jgi:hypothetical protein
MVYHGWFSYWDNICHNATIDHGWPWFIFILWQYLSQCDIGPWLNMVNKGWKWLTMINKGWKWLKMVDFHIETIFVTLWCWIMVDHGWFSYWDNLCHNGTLDHGLLSYWDNIFHNVMLDHAWFSYWENILRNVTLNHVYFRVYNIYLRVYILSIIILISSV